MSIYQRPLPMSFINVNAEDSDKLSGESYRNRLVSLLSQDLDFHEQSSSYSLHNFHSFPAKFPPQLPHKFVNSLTSPGDIVLDPMMGSGTTILEALLNGRRGVGFDIDPLAVMLSRVKTTPIGADQIASVGSQILRQAKTAARERHSLLMQRLTDRWDARSQQFVDYWFAPETQLELLALIQEIEKIPDPEIRLFFKLIFSSVIITKSGGVSLAIDLAHTRPHRAKTIISATGKILFDESADDSTQHPQILTKKLRSAFDEFEKRLQKNLDSILTLVSGDIRPDINFGNAQSLPLAGNVIDLIVTSPPYASNAIDYMRAHKFSLVWMGYSIDSLGEKRGKYIGGEAINDFGFQKLPDATAGIVAQIAALSPKKGLVLHRYYSEMTQVLREMFRVLKPGTAAIVVVGSSIMKGKDTETQNCLADIGRSIGFEVPKIGIRLLDRNRRMMPAGSNINLGSQIQQRMHKEYVIGFYKPEIYRIKQKNIRVYSRPLAVNPR